jgi:hypothetical protein
MGWAVAVLVRAAVRRSAESRSAVNRAMSGTPACSANPMSVSRGRSGCPLEGAAA